MRILQVIPTLSKGGAEAVVVDLSNSLTQLGHQVTVLTAYLVEETESRASSLQTDIELRYLSSVAPGRIRSYVNVMRFIAKNRRYIKQFDVIHCHLSLGQFFGFIWWAYELFQLGRGPRLVYTCHNVGANSPKWQGPLDQLSTRIFDVFVLMAQNTTWKVFAADHKKRNLFFIENGISFAMEMKVNRFDAWTTRTLAIGTISRLQIERKPWRFLEVFASLKEISNREFRFILGGDGPLRSSLETQARELRLADQVIFPGIILDPESFLDSIDIYLTLNTESVTGIAGLEAVFSGIPVVALQSLPNYRATDDDWIWSSTDSSEVAKTILEISLNRTRALSLVSNQQMIASQRFKSETMTRKYIEVYEKDVLSNGNYGLVEIHQVKIL